jgi:hypothetical protein
VKNRAQEVNFGLFKNINSSSTSGMMSSTLAKPYGSTNDVEKVDNNASRTSAKNHSSTNVSREIK